MNKPGSLAEWFNDPPLDEEGEIVEVIHSSEGAEEALRSWQDECLTYGANWIKRNAIRKIVVATATGVVIGAVNKAGVETGFPVGAGIVCAALGTDALVRKLRGMKANYDSKGIGIVRR